MFDCFIEVKILKIIQALVKEFSNLCTRFSKITKKNRLINLQNSLFPFHFRLATSTYAPLPEVAIVSADLNVRL